MTVRVFVCVSVLSLLLLLLSPLPCRAFDPYAEADDTVSGAVPATATVACTLGPDGAELCESAAKHVPSDEQLQMQMQQAEQEKKEMEEKREKARAEREAKFEAERQAKREAKRKAEEEAKKQQQQQQQQHDKHHPHKDDYKGLSAPLKRLRQTYYKFFGVESDASKIAIRRAANTMALDNHPDKCASTACKERMIIINAARDVLLNDETRAEYDFLVRFGFKVYDKELYDDMKQLYDAGEEVPHDFDDDEFDPGSDYSVMRVSEEGAGWLLLLCGSITAAMMAWPIAKFWQKGQDKQQQKQQLMQQMKEQQQKQQQANSIKKKQEKYNGDRSNKRFQQEDKQKN